MAQLKKVAAEAAAEAAAEVRWGGDVMPLSLRPPRSPAEASPLPLLLLGDESIVGSGIATAARFAFFCLAVAVAAPLV